MRETEVVRIALPDWAWSHAEDHSVSTKGQRSDFDTHVSARSRERVGQRIVSLDLPGRFGGQPPKPPTMQPWGLRIPDVVDPSGVLWHVAQRRPTEAHDLYGLTFHDTRVSHEQTAGDFTDPRLARCADRLGRCQA